MCSSRPFFFRKCCSHKSQPNGRSAQSTRSRCFFKFPFLLNTVPHLSHAYSPCFHECLFFLCSCSFSSSSNSSKQSAHRCGRSGSLWVLTQCCTRSASFGKARSHFRHFRCLFSWICWCFLRWGICRKLFGHWSHWNGFSLEWVSTCRLSIDKQIER